MAKMTDDEILSLAREELESADTHSVSQIREQRINSQAIYNNEKRGQLRESRGLSGAWLNEHFDYTERMTTYLAKAVTADPEVVVLETMNDKLQAPARQAQTLLNWALMRRNPGYNVLSRWIKDALINKTSIVKTFWDSSPIVWTEEVDIGNRTIEDYIAFQQNMMGMDVELKVIGKPKVEMVQEEVTSYDDDFNETTYMEDTNVVSQVYTIQHSCPRGLVWENIPREEFVHNVELVSLDDENARFVGQRRETMVGNLWKMYPDVFKKLMRESGASSKDDLAKEISAETTQTNLSYDYERINRYAFDGTYEITDDIGSADPLTRKVDVVEGYYKMDVENQGILQWVKVVWAGNVIFEKVVVEDHPFSSYTPFWIPNKFDGQSVFDVIQSTMLAQTGLIRSKIDNSIQRNIVRLVGNTTKMDDRGFSQGRPGPIHMKNMHEGAVKFLETPMGATDTVQLLQYLDQKISAKLGISSVNDGTNVDLLKSGNSDLKVQAVQQQANQNIEMYVRELTENGLKAVMWKAFKILLDNADSYFVINALSKLEGMQMDQASQMPIAPTFLAAEDGKRDWFDKADFSAKTGLGIMTRKEKAQTIIAATQVIQGLEGQGVPVAPMKKRKMAEDALKNMGVDNYLDYLPSEEEATRAIQQVEQVQAAKEQEQNMAKQLIVEKMKAEIEELMSKAHKNMTDAEAKMFELELKRIQTMAEIELNAQPKFQ